MQPLPTAAPVEPAHALRPRRPDRRRPRRVRRRRDARPRRSPPDATSSVAPAATGTPPASAPASAAAAFPLTLTDDEGTAVEIAEEPDTIVSLTPAATETLFALGVGDRIVGKGSDFFLYPPAASAIPDVQSFDGTELKVDVEQIVALEPDVVFAGGNFGTPPADIERLRIPRHPGRRASTPRRSRRSSTTSSCSATRSGAATRPTRSSRRCRPGSTRSRTSVAGQPRPRVFYELDATGAIYGPADNSFLAEMIELAGARAGHDRIGRPVRHPRRAAHLRGPGGHPAGRRAVRRDAGTGRGSARLGRHHRRQERRHPADRRPDGHPARASPAPRPPAPGIDDPPGCAGAVTSAHSAGGLSGMAAGRGALVPARPMVGRVGRARGRSVWLGARRHRRAGRCAGPRDRRSAASRSRPTDRSPSSPSACSASTSA